jgi:hypothetical protein
MVSPWFRTTADLATASAYTAELDILKDTLKISDDPSRIENKITLQYGLAPTLAEPWTGSVILQDIDSQTAIGEIKPRTLQLWCVLSGAVAQAIGSARLARRRFPPRVVEWESDMGGLTDDLGTLVLITHPDGYGAAGWVAEPCIITRHEFDPAALKVQLTAEDMSWQLGTGASGGGGIAPPVIPTSVDGMSMGTDSIQQILETILLNEQVTWPVHEPSDDGTFATDDLQGLAWPPELTPLLRDENVED